MFFVFMKDQEIKIRNMGRMDAYFVTVQMGEIQFMLRELGSKYSVSFSVPDDVQRAEVLAVTEKNIITQEFERELSGKFTERIKQLIPKETIIHILFHDFYSLDVPKDHPLFSKHELIEPFVELMFLESETVYQEKGEEMREYENYLYELHGIQLKKLKGMDILLAKCLTAMTYLHLTKEEMAKHFLKILRI
ncbi:hypothetical protein [Lysinibacillus sp. LZ02]|uniref:hypothetical protein n=1 Tax=Lysinibacillus sp. LZ02 TaxID=3420668 RepID=UPI003D36D427